MAVQQRFEVQRGGRDARALLDLERELARRDQVGAEPDGEDARGAVDVRGELLDPRPHGQRAVDRRAGAASGRPRVRAPSRRRRGSCSCRPPCGTTSGRRSGVVERVVGSRPRAASRPRAPMLAVTAPALARRLEREDRGARRALVRDADADAARRAGRARRRAPGGPRAASACRVRAAPPSSSAATASAPCSEVPQPVTTIGSPASAAARDGRRRWPRCRPPAPREIGPARPGSAPGSSPPSPTAARRATRG